SGWWVLNKMGGSGGRVVDWKKGRRRTTRADLKRGGRGYAIFFDYVKEVGKPVAKTEEEGPPRRKTGIRWLYPFFRPFTGMMISAVALAFMGSSLEMLRPVFTQILMDRVLVGNDLDLLKVVTIALFSVFCFNIIALASH